MILRLSDFRFPDSIARLYPDNPDGPWVLEIGFGDGRFWAEQGTVERSVNYLGVELSGVSLLKAQRRLKASGLSNAHLTKMPAMTLLRSVVPPQSLARIVVNFPDPWPKAGHEEHRLLRRPFFGLAASRLAAGGEVWFTTDHEEYFEFGVREGRESGWFDVELTEPPPATLRTKYALKWKDLGLGAQHAKFKVHSRPVVPGLAVEGDSNDLPHAILTLPSTFDLKDFEKTVVRHGSTTVVLLDAYRAARRDEWAILAHVEEEDLTQEALVAILPKEDGRTLVKLDRFGGVIVTSGIKAAVGAVTNLLEARGATVHTRAY
ncbi:tRNA (guanine-N7)-methyltransferase [Deinococcus yavapaiensis]|uniref:tRNA (guanine-N(7)-)-methyltransferase n=1 Tax=Deinococcus yavapaiensis KR-236 TaxID=694435 RepID=A0A318S1Q2_9DEIO|nr:tRNA (guanine-N7)-methyltransferase [Deinococcus yavapaiensis]PYE51156.1 tRNA (guanine-N(7)-)-methyltransferase [Deinococcus yavapaiensis KR-236]